jgi:hypothetical protein
VLRKQTLVIYFITAFQKLIKSMEQNGFDDTEILISVVKTKSGELFAANGAHRIAVAMVLCIDVCVEMVNSGVHRWHVDYFLKRVWNPRHVETIMAHWVNIDKESIVAVLFPKSITDNNTQLQGALDILKDCSQDSQVLVKKDIAMNSWTPLNPAFQNWPLTTFNVHLQQVQA